MSTTTFRDEQRLRNPGFLALLLLFSVLTAYRLLLLLQQGAPTVRDLVVFSTIAGLLGLGWYFTYRLRLRIKVNTRCLKVKVKGLLGRKLKLSFCDILECRYVDIPPAARWSGDLAHPAADFTSIDFGGRRGIWLSMRDGQSYFIGSDALYAQRHELPLPVSAVDSQQP